MMKSPSKLKPDTTPLFLDTSVLINLLASERIDAVAKALKRRLIVEETVVRELKRHPKTKEDGQAVVRRLTADGVVEIRKMNEDELKRFMALVGAAPPDDLDDGEAATIACSVGTGFAVIDESKARRVATRDFSSLAIYSTLDLLGSAQAFDHIEKEELRRAVAQAREIGRMRVPPEWRSWYSTFVVDGSTPASASDGNAHPPVKLNR